MWPHLMLLHILFSYWFAHWAECPLMIHPRDVRMQASRIQIQIQIQIQVPQIRFRIQMNQLFGVWIWSWIQFKKPWIQIWIRIWIQICTSLIYQQASHLKHVKSHDIFFILDFYFFLHSGNHSRFSTTSVSLSVLDTIQPNHNFFYLLFFFKFGTVAKDHHLQPYIVCFIHVFKG